MVTTRFIFSAVGTRGDIFPMLSLAQELQERGHVCQMLGTEVGAARARELGVEYATVAPTQHNNIKGMEEIFSRYVFPSYEPTFAFFERELVAGHRPVVVCRGPYSASNLMAQRHGLHQVRVLLAPYEVRSLVSPPSPWREKCGGLLGRSFRKHGLPRVYESGERHPYVIERVNAFRRALGMDPIESAREHERFFEMQLGLFPKWYADPASDWPELSAVGFPLPTESGKLPDDVLSLIENHGRPLVFTPGTGVDDVKEFFEAASGCCQRLGLPGILLSPHAASVDGGCSKVLCKDFLPLGVLLSHCRLLVHHGGIGSTARAFEAGLPQIIVPRAFDQPDNARRVRELGVGSSLRHVDLNAEALAGAASSLMADRELSSRATELSERVRSKRPLSRAADLIERRFGLDETLASAC